MPSVKLRQTDFNKISKPYYERKHLHVFISYSSVDKVYAGELKDYLKGYGLSVFLAHEDIRPTLDWQKEILKNLRSCDVFVAIYSPNFSQSEWTDQETGIAFGLDKFIIPVRMGEDPYGFIGRFQGCKSDSPANVLDVINSNSSLRELIIDCYLRALEKAEHFDDAKSIVEELEKLKLNKPEVNEVIRIAIKNDQFRRCWNGIKFLKRISKEHSEEIIPLFRRVFDKVKDDNSFAYAEST